MSVWRLQVRTGGKNISQYCLKNNVVAMGWSLGELTMGERDSINTFQEYYNYAKKMYTKFDSVCRMVEDVKENDLIWMRSEGKYYIARIKKETSWKFCNTQEAMEMDACNQLINIKWYLATEFGDEVSVPGAISTSFIGGSTIQRIRKNGVEEYSQMLFNEVHDINEDTFIYPKPNMTLDEYNFYTLLQPEDVEDLLAIWLFDTKGYICIPSTNKVATPKYECVLLDPNDSNKKHIYIQVKKGMVDLDAKEYSELNGEVYLLTTEGKVNNAKEFDNITVVSSTEIYEFTLNPDKEHIIPENILLWVKFLSDLEIKNNPILEQKGIMFDTNISYSDDNELQMLKKNRICAYSKAKRYINCFNYGDFVLYYSKGKGIIAIGRVKSSQSIELENQDGLYHEVELIVPMKKQWDKDDIRWISVKEIKELLHRGFYFASTIKTPFLTADQVHILIEELEKKYQS